MYQGGAYLLYRDAFDRAPDLTEIRSLLAGLDCAETITLLCQISADLRLTERERLSFAKTQQDIAGAFFDDETIRRLKQRFSNVHMADRPAFHAPQILNIIRLTVQYSDGDEKPLSDSSARYKVGTASLMMNDLMLTADEEVAISTGTDDARMRALMTQVLGSFEVLNTAAITHVLYRSRVMFHILLNEPRVLTRISNECDGFDFSREFRRLVGIPLSNWLFLLFALYAYLSHYHAPDNTRQPEYLAIDPTKFLGHSRVSQAELAAVLKTLSARLLEFRAMLEESRPTVWRYDFVPFKSKPFIELYPDVFYCHDLGFLVEKMHSGVYWAIFHGLAQAERPNLFKAWGLLFEEYVNWFLSEHEFKHPLLFFPSPRWSDQTESFDGAFMQDTRFMPMEYKGRFLKVEARYSGNPDAFEADLDLKIGEGCRQLARKIELLFDADTSRRRTLKNVSLDHIARVISVLVVQDQILDGPFVNWRLNQEFQRQLQRDRLRPNVTVEPVNVVGIEELETMAESAEGGTYDIFHGLQLRCFQDPLMRSGLHNFLLGVPGYGQGKSTRIEGILEDQFKEIAEYLFPPERRI